MAVKRKQKMQPTMNRKKPRTTKSLLDLSQDEIGIIFQFLSEKTAHNFILTNTKIRHVFLNHTQCSHVHKTIVETCKLINSMDIKQGLKLLEKLSNKLNHKINKLEINKLTVEVKQKVEKWIKQKENDIDEFMQPPPLVKENERDELLTLVPTYCLLEWKKERMDYRYSVFFVFTLTVQQHKTIHFLYSGYDEEGCRIDNNLSWKIVENDEDLYQRGDPEIEDLLVYSGTELIDTRSGLNCLKKELGLKKCSLETLFYFLQMLLPLRFSENLCFFGLRHQVKEMFAGKKRRKIF